jgi:hypothetical protein
MKKEYNTPTIEIALLATNRLMTLGDTSAHIGGGASGAPAARHDRVF